MGVAGQMAGKNASGLERISLSPIAQYYLRLFSNGAAPTQLARGSLLSMSRFFERHAKGSVLASTLIACIFRLGLTFFD
jgi:hypothetical protein